MRNAGHGVILEHVLGHVRGLLEREGIPSLALKGPMLARAAHGDPALRASADLDVLVSLRDLERAAQSLAAAGFGSPADPLDRAGLPELHLTLAHPEPWGPSVELHWRVHWADATHGAALLTMSRQGDAARAAAELAVLLLCYARDGFVGTRLASDISGWWDAHAGELAPQALDPLAFEHPGLLPVLATAAIVAERVCGVPAPRILGAAALGRANSRAARLADPEAAGDVQQLRAQQIAVDLLLVSRGGARAFLRRQIIDGRRLSRRRHRMTHLPKTAVRVTAALVRG